MTTHWSPTTDQLDPGAGKRYTAHDLLSRNTERYRALVRAGALVLWRADLSGRMTAVTGWQQLTGKPETEALGRGFLDGFHPEDRTALDFRNRQIGDTVEAECRVLGRDGRWRWVRGRGVLLPASGGFPAEWVGTLEDIHDQRRALDRARYLAERDALTGLGNRRTLASDLARLRDRQASAVIVMLDVDGFKAINDQHGHQIGDRCLVRLAQLLVAAAPRHSLCARMGGDEFCVVAADPAEAHSLCARLCESIGSGLVIGDLLLPLHFSAGIAEADWNEPDPASRVLRKAGLALRHAKGRGRCVIDHTPQMQAEADARDEILRAIGPACRNDEFFVEYQPIVNVDAGAPVSFEALVRWQHPHFGRVEPSLFVRLAEQNGLIGQLGRWVLSRVCADMATAPTLRVNVNVSARQIANPGFADDLRNIARTFGIAPDRLTLELTESVNMAVLVGSDMFTRLREHGFRIVLDDFGTEYAVLSHVSSGQFDGIKLARDFVAHCATVERARVVIRHIVSLCNDLGMEVVAEGVETADELACLHQQGVRLMQGYHFGRPRGMAGLPRPLAIPA